MLLSLLLLLFCRGKRNRVSHGSHRIEACTTRTRRWTTSPYYHCGHIGSGGGGGGGGGGGQVACTLPASQAEEQRRRTGGTAGGGQPAAHTHARTGDAGSRRGAVLLCISASGKTGSRRRHPHAAAQRGFFFPSFYAVLRRSAPVLDRWRRCSWQAGARALAASGGPLSDYGVLRTEHAITYS